MICISEYIELVSSDQKKRLRILLSEAWREGGKDGCLCHLNCSAFTKHGTILFSAFFWWVFSAEKENGPFGLGIEYGAKLLERLGP